MGGGGQIKEVGDGGGQERGMGWSTTGTRVGEKVEYGWGWGGGGGDVRGCRRS